MWVSVLLVMLIFIGLAILLQGWVFQRAARFFGLELSLLYATGVAFGAGLANFAGQLLIALLVVGTSPVWSLQAVADDQTLISWTSWIFGLVTWTAVTSVLLDVDIPKAALIGLAFSILQVVLAIVVMITLFNVLLIGSMAVVMGS
jgi:hypothetical protein